MDADDEKLNEGLKYQWLYHCADLVQESKFDTGSSGKNPEQMGWNEIMMCNIRLHSRYYLPCCLINSW